MKEFSELGRLMKKLPAEIRSLIEKRIELTLIVFSEQASSILSKQIYKSMGVVVLAVGAILILQATALYVGDLLNNRALGYLVTAAPILIAGAMLVSLKPRFIVNKVREEILGQLLIAVEQANPSNARKKKEETKALRDSEQQSESNKTIGEEAKTHASADDFSHR